MCSKGIEFVLVLDGLFDGYFWYCKFEDFNWVILSMGFVFEEFFVKLLCELLIICVICDIWMLVVYDRVKKLGIFVVGFVIFFVIFVYCVFYFLIFLVVGMILLLFLVGYILFLNLCSLMFGLLWSDVEVVVW